MLGAWDWSSSWVVRPLTPRASPRPSPPRGRGWALSAPITGGHRGADAGSASGAWLPARDGGRVPPTLSPRGRGSRRSTRGEGANHVGWGPEPRTQPHQPAGKQEERHANARARRVTAAARASREFPAGRLLGAGRVEFPQQQPQLEAVPHRGGDARRRPHVLGQLGVGRRRVQGAVATAGPPPGPSPLRGRRRRPAPPPGTPATGTRARRPSGTAPRHAAGRPRRPPAPSPGSPPLQPPCRPGPAPPPG